VIDTENESDPPGGIVFDPGLTIRSHAYTVVMPFVNTRRDNRPTKVTMFAMRLKAIHAMTIAGGYYD